MSESVAAQQGVRHRHNFDDVPLVMAKAVVTKGDEERGRAKWGAILRRTVELAGLIEKEAADRLKVERSQFSRWLNGKENQQTWRFQEDELLGPALIAAQAEVTPGATVRTVIELTRKVG